MKYNETFSNIKYATTERDHENEPNVGGHCGEEKKNNTKKIY